MSRSRDSLRRLFSSPCAMVVTALVIRLVVMACVFRMHLDPALDHKAFGYET